MGQGLRSKEVGQGLGSRGGARAWVGDALVKT